MDSEVGVFLGEKFYLPHCWLFNSLKVQYQKKNLYTFDQLVEALGKSRTITIHPAVSEDFHDYGDLFDFFYKKLAGQIKQNHIFSLFDG